jgi:hypothetical protein
MKKLIVSMIVLGAATFAQATLINSDVTAAEVTAVNVSGATGAAMRTTWGNWWLDWYRQGDYEASQAAINWDLVETKGSTYDFSGEEMTFNAQNSALANAVYVRLIKDGTTVWTSGGQVLGSLQPHSWTVPVGAAYNDIDTIQFLFSSPAYVAGGYWGAKATAMMSGFTSTADVPEPASMCLVLSGGSLLLARMRNFRAHRKA